MVSAQHIGATRSEVPMIVLSALRREWMGDGVYLGRGNFTEALWTAISLFIGISIAVDPDAAWENSHVLTLMLWRWPVAWVAATFIFFPVLSIAGIVLSFVRDRCVASRLLRWGGAQGGFSIWMILLYCALFVEPSYNCMSTALALTATLAYLRIVFISYRRF